VTWPIAVLHVNDAISDDMVDNIHTCAALINPKANFANRYFAAPTTLHILTGRPPPSHPPLID